LEEKKSAKEGLLEELKNLGDIFADYSLTEREQFLSDFENILKVLSH